MRIRTGAVLAVLSLGLGSCGLFNTGDSEASAGRGTQVFDPYAGPESGAIRLTLQSYNGCAYRGDGEFASKGNANIPYPADADCKAAVQGYGPGRAGVSSQPPGLARTPIPLIAGTNYFLHQLTFVDTVEDLHNNAADMDSVLSWMKTKTRFKNVDWTNVGVTSDRWYTAEESVYPYVFDHRVEFGNAKWLSDTSDRFLLEVLDVDGQPRQSIEYSRQDFLSENWVTGHTQVFWAQLGVGPPRFPGDTEVQPVPTGPTTYPPLTAPHTQTMVRFDMEYSTRPSKSFRLDPALVGDGAIRVTWSKMPNDPVYFPVTFIRNEELPLNCYKGDDPTQRVACTFGLKPEIKVVPPANGTHFVPGEYVTMVFAIKDGNGNLLHDPEYLPSWNEFATGQSNGIIYGSTWLLHGAREYDSMTGYQVSGPHQNAKLWYELDQKDYFFVSADSFEKEAVLGTIPFMAIPTDALAWYNYIPGLRDLRPTTKYVVHLPEDARPGTYTILLKAHRQFMGEDFSKMVPLEIPVDLPGKAKPEPTKFPGRIGNCQICHRGVISLENIRHGISVDFVEDCKACHSRNAFPGGSATMHRLIHQVHSSSPKYPQKKNDCTFCHLTKESALRPSIVVCSSCHPQVHGTAFFKQSLESGFIPTENGRFGNCAEQCHMNTPPTAHILPAQ